MDSQPESDKQLPVSAIAALHDGKKIKAIKIVREEHGISLKEAKDTVENYLTTHPELQSQLDRCQAESIRAGLPWFFALILLIILVLYF